MLKVRSFQGLVPAPGLAAKVACVPYDVVNSAEAAALAEGNPHTLLRVDRAEMDCPPDTDLHSDVVYAKAVENFKKLQQDGVLVRESAPCIYLYQQTMNGRSQTGIAAVCHIEDYEKDLIKKHEKTRKDKEDDRTRLIGDLAANTGPVFLTFRDDAALNALMEKTLQGGPDVSFVAPDGVGHSVWRIEGGGDYTRAFAQIPCSYVADGHHRTASAARVGRELREKNPTHTGDEEYNWFLCVMFPASQLQILPYNRAVTDLNGHSPGSFLKACAEEFEISDAPSPSPSEPGVVHMFLAKKWYALRPITPLPADPVSRLDVSWLQDRLLAPLLGIDDPRTSQRIEFIGGIRGTGELEQRVQSGQAAVAFSMFPTTVDQLMEIADAGQIMPPKSTWFEPKLRSGLFIHTFGEN